MADPVLLAIDVEDSWFATGSEKWHQDRETLRGELERQLGPDAVRQGSARSGDKGLPLIPIIIALGSAGAFQALAKVFDSWLRYRPGERTLTVTSTVDGKEQTVRLVAQNASIDALKPLFRTSDESAG
jgi:hypothetical protein